MPIKILFLIKMYQNSVPPEGKPLVHARYTTNARGQEFETPCCFRHRLFMLSLVSVGVSSVTGPSAQGDVGKWGAIMYFY
jgi:hypothetical protein